MFIIVLLNIAIELCDNSFVIFKVSFADDHLTLPPPPADLDSAISSSTTIAAFVEDAATEAANDLAMAEQVSI